MLMTKKKDMVCLLGRMGDNTKDNGKMDSRMVRGK